MYRSRWIARLDRAVELLLPVLATLEDISLSKKGVIGAGNWNSASRDDAQALTNAVTFECIATLVIVNTGDRGTRRELQTEKK